MSTIFIHVAAGGIESVWTWYNPNQFEADCNHKGDYASITKCYL